MCLHAVDGEPAVAVDSASVEPTTITIMSIDAGGGAHLEHPNTPQHLSRAVSCSAVI